MKKIIVSLIVFFSLLQLQAQQSPSGKLGWFITPEVGVMFLDDHVGNTVGASFGIKLFKSHLKIGIHGYGRSGPINPSTFSIEASDGQVYKGSSQLQLRADHGAFGLLVAPRFSIKNIGFEVPINYGMVGGGFYLFDEDRETPDGDRVSTWENRLMDGRDAGFGDWFEIGIRTLFPTKNESVSWGLGAHYTITRGWETYYDPTGDFYNQKFRMALFVNFESR